MSEREKALSDALEEILQRTYRANPSPDDLAYEIGYIRGIAKSALRKPDEYGQPA